MSSETVIRGFGLLLLMVGILPLALPLIMGGGIFAIVGILGIPFLPLAVVLLAVLTSLAFFAILPGIFTWRLGTLVGQMAKGKRDPLETHIILRLALGVSGLLTLCFGVGAVLLLLACAGPARLAGFQPDGTPLLKG